MMVCHNGFCMMNGIPILPAKETCNMWKEKKGGGILVF